MNIECVICLENLQPTEAISNTPCGHVFHSSCVSLWLKKSLTCPECRKKLSGKKLHRIHFNFVNDNIIMEEITAILESEIDTLKHQLTVKNEEIAQGLAKEIALSEENDRLQSKVEDLTTEVKDNIGKLEKIDSKVQSVEDEISEIIKNLRDTIKGYMTEKTMNSKSSTTDSE